MEPLKPDDKKRAMAANPNAAPEDIQEYERLLAARFARDPNVPAPPLKPLAAPDSNSDVRLKQLYKKLFPNG